MIFSIKCALLWVRAGCVFLRIWELIKPTLILVKNLVGVSFTSLNERTGTYGGKLAHLGNVKNMTQCGVMMM